jgi:alpha-L-rhamnosidase
MGISDMLRPYFPEDAFWIGPAHPFDLQEVYLCFRRTWQLERDPKKVELFITADSRYKLWVNDRFVSRGPARCYPHAQSVDRLDVSSYVQTGLNCLAVQVYQPGYSHFAYVHRGVAGLLAHLTCDGSSVLATDAGWRTRRDPSFASLVPRVSIYGSGVEERDLNLDDQWRSASYDDSTWSPPRIVAPVGGYPWTNLEPRAIPLLAEREVPMTLMETRCGDHASALDPDAHLALRQGWFSAQTLAIRADEEGWFTPKLAESESAYWLFDLGRDYSCQGWAEVEGASGRERLSISYAEKIREGQLVLSDPQTYCRVRLTDRFRLRPGNQVVESFALRGGRYLLFQLTGPTGVDFKIRFHTRTAEYPLQVKRSLHISDPLLSKIVNICEETFRACLLDGFVDSTWRESSQWTGDALPQALIMSALSDDTRPLRRVIEMAAQDPYPDGVLPSVLPGEVHAYTIVDYNFIWVELLALYWQLTRDQDFVTAMWPPLVRMLDRFDQDLNDAGLIISQPGRRLFLDWAPVSRQEPNAIYNLHYLLALRRAAALATEIGEVGQCAIWTGRAGRLQVAARAAFWQQNRWYDDLPRTTCSQLAGALALLAGATESGEENDLVQAIAARSLDPDDSFDPRKMVLASPFMHHYVFEALRRGGRSGEVVEIIRRRWGRWVGAGYPTTWENWNVDFADGSQCHAFSAHPRYHLAEIARVQGGL